MDENKQQIAEGQVQQDRIARIILPDEQAVVRILEVLAPFAKRQRALILQVVEANSDYPPLATAQAARFGNFLAERCELYTGLSTIDTMLFASYDDWLAKAGVEVGAYDRVSHRVALEEFLSALGCNRVLIGQYCGWSGIRLKRPSSDAL